MDVSLQRLLLGRDGRSQMLTGLRGVGKTVLLRIRADRGRTRLFPRPPRGARGGRPPVAACRRVPAHPAHHGRQKANWRWILRSLGILKAFTLRLPGGPELTIDVDAVHGPADSGDLAMDLSGLFVELGEVAPTTPPVF